MIDQEIAYCDSCRHCRRVNDVLGVMECRRFPPVPDQTYTTKGIFPYVDKHTWCGEYQPKRKIGDEPNAKVSG